MYVLALTLCTSLHLSTCHPAAHPTAFQTYDACAHTRAELMKTMTESGVYAIAACLKVDVGTPL